MSGVDVWRLFLLSLYCKEAQLSYVFEKNRSSDKLKVIGLRSCVDLFFFIFVIFLKKKLSRLFGGISMVKNQLIVSSQCLLSRFRHGFVSHHIKIN